MTLTDELKILDDKIKANNKDLGYKPGVVERAKFEYSPLAEVLSGKVKKKKKNTKHKIIKKDKQNKNVVYNQQHSFAKFQDTSAFKEFSIDSMHKKLN